MTFREFAAFAEAPPGSCNFKMQVIHIDDVLGGDLSRSTRTNDRGVDTCKTAKEEEGGEEGPRRAQRARKKAAKQEEGPAARRPRIRGLPAGEGRGCARNSERTRWLRQRPRLPEGYRTPHFKAAAAKRSAKADTPKNKNEKIRKPAPSENRGEGCCQDQGSHEDQTLEDAFQTPAQTDRALLLAHPQRLEDHHHAGGVGLPYVIKPVNIGKGEQFAPAFLENLPQQPHAGDRRSRRAWRRAHLGLRVRRDPAISRPQDRQVLPHRRAQARGRWRNGCSGRWAAWAHGGAGQPFPQLRRRQRLCQEALHRRGASPVRGDGQAACRPANSLPATIPSPIWRASAG